MKAGGHPCVSYFEYDDGSMSLSRASCPVTRISPSESEWPCRPPI